MANTACLTYYQRNKEFVLSKQAQGKYNNVPEEEKDKKREYRRNKYYAASEEERIKRNEYHRIRYCNLAEEKKNIIREQARNRYHTMVKVRW